MDMSLLQNQIPLEAERNNQHDEEKKIKVSVIFFNEETSLETTCERLLSDLKYRFAISHPEDYIFIQKFIRENNCFVDVSPHDIVEDCCIRISVADKPCQIQSQRLLTQAQPVATMPTKSILSNSLFNSSVEAEKIFANFCLPQFSEHLQQKLDCEKQLDTEEKRKIIVDLGNAIETLTYYPPIAQLFKVVEMFLKKYPYIVKGINPEIGKQSWARQLQEYFVECGIKLATKKRKKKTSKSKKEKSICQESHRIHHSNEKLDRATQTNQRFVHIDMSNVILKIKQEWLKPDPDMDFIRKYMGITYRTRRSFIMLENPKISYLKEIYPALFTAEEVKNDLYRYACTDKQVFHRNLTRYSSIILEIPGTNEAMKKDILAAQRENRTFDERIVPILLIPSLLGENLDFLCFSDKPFNKKQVYPWINCNANLQEVLRGYGNYKVYAENMLICEPENLIEAVHCLIASYFVFNIEYTSKYLKTLQIFQKLFLEIEENKSDENEVTPLPIMKEVVDLMEILQKSIESREYKS